MQNLLKPEKIVTDILGAPAKDGKLRPLEWTHVMQHKRGPVFHNFLTGECLLFERDDFISGEFDGFCESLKEEEGRPFSKESKRASDLKLMDIIKKDVRQSLLEKYFLVADDTDDMKLADEVRAVCKLLNNKKGITSYKILTTTSCNARCAYCYEAGIPFKDMTHEDAEKIIDYIKNNAQAEKVNLAWFGGEPLMRADIIDLICKGLRDADIKYTSVMTTNGYIFNEDLIKRAKDLWDLSNIQITLDGPEEAYNNIKNYIGWKKGSGISPYYKVIENIKALAKNEIFVNIRINAGVYNIPQVKDLIEDLNRIFGNFEGKRYISAYIGGLFDDLEEDGPLKDKLIEDIEELTDMLEAYGFTSYSKGSLRLRTGSCMADNDSHRGFAPGGGIIKCEHYIYEKEIGSLYDDDSNFDLSEWKERLKPGKLCRGCAVYPTCYKLKVCPVAHICSEAERAQAVRNAERALSYILNKQE